MEWIEKYIYAVTSRLPEKQREDIEKELKGLIEDMLEERSKGDSPSPEEIEEVLLELGPPADLADSYRGKKRYLISPIMFDAYWSTMKVVLTSLSIVLFVIFAIETIVEPFSILEHFVQWIVSLITANAQAFGWVTLVFFLIDYARPSDEELQSKNMEWSPKDLPEIPDETKRIKLSEPISGIVFITLFLVVCFYSINLLGVYAFRTEVRDVIPFLDASVFNRYLPLIAVAAGLGLLNEGVKLFVRKRTGKMLVWNVSLRLLSVAVLAIIFANESIWNPTFMEQLTATGIVTPGSEGYATIAQIWNQGTQNFFAIIVLFFIIDVVTETYKWYKAR